MPTTGAVSARQRPALALNVRGSPCAKFQADWLQQVWFAGNHSDDAGVIERDRVSLSGGQDLAAFVALATEDAEARGRGAVAASRCREWTERELDKAIQAMLEGVPAAKLKDKIGTLEARKHEHLLEAVQQRLDANPEAMRQLARQSSIRSAREGSHGSDALPEQTLPKVATEMPLGSGL
ncbi:MULTISPECIES: DUF2235 domain-containing protein [Bradyrhizobium]|jgi:hypothetical protein|nr:DUF2235 domain-containing protein [Bradyrhizobium japonicum]MCS3537562.1 hypothetical protein [Bradyrhizobium japonicum]MCS3986352.1 hypothetical protein [Bradyrhizobium japonicum]MCS4018833.1 hypothetical protein [Bradyrhizobium japonicum]MCS4205941.1 hypothetical protein [Bradyrhizobium japonicum]MDH6176756.1 hypothetical protein [Bradyrhizobium japonicum]